MTRMGKISTLAMSITEGFGKEKFDGLVEENDLNELSSRSSWADEEEEEYVKPVVKAKTKKPHLLDLSSKEAIFRGGWLRHSFYKTHVRKTPLTISTNQTESTCCRACNSKVADSLDKDNLRGSFALSEVYLKSEDSQDRNLSETALALLMLFDWVGICNECSELNYGHFKVETERQSFKEIVQDTKNRIEESLAIGDPLQLSIFDYDDVGNFVSR